MAGTVQSVERALDILELLSQYEKGLSIKEISIKSELHKSTVHRLLGTLIEKGYVSQDKLTSHYYVTLKLYRLGSRRVENTDLIQICKPYLQKLGQLTGEVVHLVLREDIHVVYVDKVESTQTIRMHSRIGNRNPLYSTGVGKAILATLPEEEVLDVWSRSEISKLTPYTITDQAHLDQELKTISKEGYAKDNEENELGVRCVAAAILNKDGVGDAAISISAPLQRMSEEKVSQYALYLKETCGEISRLLGCR